MEGCQCDEKEMEKLTNVINIWFLKNLLQKILTLIELLSNMLKMCHIKSIFCDAESVFLSLINMLFREPIPILEDKKFW